MTKSLHPHKRPPHLRHGEHLLTPRLQGRVLPKLNLRGHGNLRIRKGQDRNISYRKPIREGNVLLSRFIQARFKDTVFLFDSGGQDLERVADGGGMADFEG